MPTAYLLWSCPECRKLVGLERNAPKNLRYCTIEKNKVVCAQTMPEQEERDNFVKFGLWSIIRKKEE